MQKYTLFSNLFDSKFQNAENSAILDASNQNFKPKSFIDTYGKYYKTAKIVGVVGGIVSALLAFYFFVVLFKNSVPAPVAVALSIVCIGGIELIKNAALSETFKSLVIGRFALAAALLSGGVLAASIYTSVEGANSYVNDTGTALISTIEKNYNDSIASVQNAENIAILDAKKEMKEYKQSVSYKGKINTSDKVVMSILASKQKKIDDLQQKYNNSLSGIEGKKGSDVAKTAENTDKTAFKMVAVALFNELVIICSLWFTFWFLAGVYKEQNAPNDNTPNDNRLNENRVDVPVIAPGGGGSPRQIGFVYGNDKKRECLNCEKEYIHKNHKQLYCSDKCRIEKWERDKNVKLKVPR